MTKLRATLLLACFLLSTAPALAAGSVREIVVPAPSLAGNLLGIPTEQRVAVYLPPSYASAPDRRYPVLYLLHGIADSYSVWTETWNVPAMADEVMGGQDAAEFLIVMPNGATRFLGSFYANSPVTGRWEDFIAGDLVGHVDATFRTLARREHRGVTGHSMGGFGAIRLAMRRADVFGSAYAMSPCCLDMVEDIGWGNPAWSEALGFRDPADADAALQRGAFYPVAIIALAQAVSPNPSRPLWVDLPIRAEGPELLPVEPTYTKWQEFFPVAEVDRHREALRSLVALRIDYGLDDQFAHIPTATRRFTERLAELRIPHEVEVYAGDHRRLVPERVRTLVLPFFARILAGPG